jgi:hypothetical protein
MENVSEGREARGIMVAIATVVKATTSGRAPFQEYSHAFEDGLMRG